VCYRRDDSSASPSTRVFFSQNRPSQLGGATAQWALSLNNGWCLYPKLFNVTNATLTFSYSSNNGSSWTAGASVIPPPTTSFVQSLLPPIISPLGSAFLGPVLVTITTQASGASTYYQLTGATYGVPQLYSGPFLVNQPGNTTVLAYSVKAGSLTSTTTLATYIISVCSHPNITSVGVAPIDGQGEDTDENPIVSLLGGSRDVSCSSTLRLRYNSSSNRGTTGRFRIARTDGGGDDINAEVYLNNGCDTVISIPTRVCGVDSSTPRIQVRRMSCFLRAPTPSFK
jgi:hypothetical protein